MNFRGMERAMKYVYPSRKPLPFPPGLMKPLRREISTFRQSSEMPCLHSWRNDFNKTLKPAPGAGFQTNCGAVERT